MKFRNANTLQSFLDDKPFYESNDCFCLGDTLAEAGCVIAEIVKVNENGAEHAEETLCGLG